MQIYRLRFTKTNLKINQTISIQKLDSSIMNNFLCDGQISLKKKTGKFFDLLHTTFFERSALF